LGEAPTCYDWVMMTGLRAPEVPVLREEKRSKRAQVLCRNAALPRGKLRDAPLSAICAGMLGRRPEAEFPAFTDCSAGQAARVLLEPSPHVPRHVEIGFLRRGAPRRHAVVSYARAEPEGAVVLGIVKSWAHEGA